MDAVITTLRAVVQDHNEDNCQALFDACLAYKRQMTTEFPHLFGDSLRPPTLATSGIISMLSRNDWAGLARKLQEIDR